MGYQCCIFLELRRSSRVRPGFLYFLFALTAEPNKQRCSRYLASFSDRRLLRSHVKTPGKPYTAFPYYFHHGNSGGSARAKQSRWRGAGGIQRFLADDNSEPFSFANRSEAPSHREALLPQLPPPVSFSQAARPLPSRGYLPLPRAMRALNRPADVRACPRLLRGKRKSAS